MFTLHNGDCHKFDVPAFDVVITDPPYPDYHAEEYEYFDGLLEFLNKYNCRQIIFWSAKVEFPLSYSAIHIWDKRNGAGSMYERIFERNGGNAYKVYRKYFINSSYAALRTRDEWTEHPSQKPIQLLRVLIEEHTKVGDVVFDPFMGSGTTGVAAMQMGRRFIGCENNTKWFSVAEKRISSAVLSPSFYTPSNTACSGRLATSAQSELFVTDDKSPSKARGATRRR